MEIAGGCLCGAVRYRATEPPIAARVCWCRLCQYIGAGSGTVNVCFKSDSLAATGEMRDFPAVADSGTRMHRRFCPGCGTHLFSEAESRPHQIFVRAGTLDDPDIIKPSGTIWTKAAPSWACFDPALPQWDGQPPPVT